ncbi:hypothetical protein [Aerosakkonema funiforme]|uniref:Uncharacterized protein n=1 Tax=Aerosakkonema funiforme FACHB-1375 TaxID=2949571 RepID=A0A926VKB9_9CYAN|nr:hypothetical protein [Aerosakkonema funiforme]MBD2185401.1 hypothetical protein [Aerosakkonema funiforme FACHB-1375]
MDFARSGRLGGDRHDAHLRKRGFWIFDWLEIERAKLEISQKFLMISIEMESLKPLFFGQWHGKIPGKA